MVRERCEHGWHFAVTQTTEIDHHVAQQLISSTSSGSIRDRYDNEELQRLAAQEQTECSPLAGLREADPDAEET